MLLNLFKPVLHIEESFFSRDIITKEYTLRATVEDSRYRPEWFLPRGVPNLKLDNFLVETNHEWAEFYADGNLVLKFKLIVHDSSQQARLANTL